MNRELRIAYVGNYTATHTTENHVALSLEDLGHEVTRIQEHPRNEPGLMDTVKGHDLFLFTRTWDNLVTLDHLKQMKDLDIPTASLHLDLYIGLQRESGLDGDPFWRTDYVFSPDGGSDEAFKRKGINHHYLKPGVYKKECYVAAPNNTIGNDVIFVGGGAPTGEGPQYGHKEWPYRGKLLKWLRDTYGESYSKYGHPDPTIRNAPLNQLYANSKVVVGDSLCLNFNHPYYWSDRVYETLGRGGFLIHPFIEGMDEEFTDRENIVFYEYNNFHQLKSLIDYYLEHDEERLRIQRAGHEYVKNNCTYNDRLTEMLGVVCG